MTTLDQEVRSAEARIDRVIRTMPLDARDLETAIWTLLTATEDSLRLPLLNTKSPLVLSDYVSSSDLTKYGLKHALNELRGRTYPQIFRKIPKSVHTTSYKQAFRLLQAGRNFQAAVAAFSAYYAGISECEIVDGVLHFRPAQDRDARYRMRDVLESMSGSEHPSPLLKLINWTIGDLPDPLLGEAAGTAVLVPGRITYVPNRMGEQFLFDDFASRRSLIPDDWTTPHGDKTTVERVLRALLAICAYHYLLVTRGASFHNVPGFGLASLVLRTSWDELRTRVERISGVSRASVAHILDLITYGERTVSPDPALQPLYPIGEDQVLCPTLMVCGSDIERNFLALLARADPTAFNDSSDVFERQMTDRLITKALDHGRWSYWHNRTFRACRTAGEIDVLILDPVSKEIIVLELWWTIPPGETREVVQREQTSMGKIEQAVRKVDAVRSNLNALLNETCPGATTGGWTVSGALVCESFLPTLRSTSGISVVSRRTIQRMLARMTALAEVRTSLTNADWLPVLGRHFNPRTVECELGGVKFTLQSMAPTMRGLIRTRDRLWD